MNDANPPKPERRWYQFHLWHLFVVTLLVAILCSIVANWLNRSPEYGETKWGIGYIDGYDLLVGYMVVTFSSGKHGVVVVAQSSKEDADISSALAKEGVVLVQIDQSTYSFPFSGKHPSRNQVRAYFDKALKQHTQVTENENTE